MLQHPWRTEANIPARPVPETLLAERLKQLPFHLTETCSVLDLLALFRAVGEAQVGTGLDADRLEAEVGRLVDDGPFVERGRDRLGLPR
ncbi:hypothetical protein JJB09_26295 [Rhizobium sp. KVB221]|uniref:Uncharacterized protein n=1 Tax=Rhizobium setariae TaxID=2801340 RepID=A0A936YWV8_9HYPH|nr:hypothetical protein [Rhizobium setariae]MBL0375522.1 hypothetical protein [Rhizobium setariae]